MKKYTYWDGQKEVIIENLPLYEMMLQQYAKYPYSPVTYMHLLTTMCPRPGADFYTYDEAKEIIESFGIDYEKHFKINIEQREKNFPARFNYICTNCNHKRSWHFQATKCCDGKCDCEFYEGKMF